MPTSLIGRWFAVLCLVVLAMPASAASYRTRNFLVKAPRPDVAREVGEYAEHYRRVKAKEWLGEELPDWPDPCQLKVVLKLGDAGGATSFAFDRGRVLGQDMTVEGPLDRILHSVLPHEVTHTIFAAKFGRPLPRWADEGGAVLSEDAIELDRHDRLVREIINTGRLIPLRRLFILTEYPTDVMALYAEGFSVANFLVSMRGKPYFLDFVWDGQVGGWDAALASYYGIYSSDDLEQRWIAWLRQGRGTGSQGLLMAGAAPTPSTATSARATGGNAFSSLGPRDPRTVVRGEMPEDPWDASPVAVAAPVRPNATDVMPRLIPAAPLAEPMDTVAAGHEWLPASRTNEPDSRELRTSASPQGTNADAFEPAPRSRPLIPIAVGRTRRAHESP